MDGYKLVMVVYCGLYQGSFKALKEQLQTAYSEVCTEDPMAL